MGGSAGLRTGNAARVAQKDRGFRLLNLPFFLVHQLDRYLEWAATGPLTAAGTGVSAS